MTMCCFRNKQNRQIFFKKNDNYAPAFKDVFTLCVCAYVWVYVQCVNGGPPTMAGLLEVEL